MMRRRRWRRRVEKEEDLGIDADVVKTEDEIKVMMWD